MSRGLADLKKPSEFRSIEGLAQVRANGRVLNLGAINRDLFDPDKDDTQGQPRFFANNGLNTAIIVKHNVRENERHLFMRLRPVATKLILPIDPDDLSLGGVTFMLGERHANRIMQDRLGLCHKSPDPKVRQDLRVINALDGLATLDPFIVRERLAVDGHHLPEAFAAFQLGGDHALQEYMKRQLTPLVALAMGSAVQPKGNERGLDRLLEEMFTGPQNGRVEMLREALRITPERWPQALYTWKAALFYEYRVRNFETRFARFLESVQATKIYAYSVAAPVEIVLPLRASLIARAQSAKAGLDRLLMTFSDAYRKDLIGSGSPDAFRDYLLSLHEKLYDFGVVYGILEQIVGYWEYWFISRGLTHVPAEFFMGIGRDLLGVVDPTTIGQSALPSFREPEPAPRPVAAAGAGAAHAVLV